MPASRQSRLKRVLPTSISETSCLKRTENQSRIIEKVSVICDLYEKPLESDYSRETQKPLHDMRQANPAFSLD